MENPQHRPADGGSSFASLLTIGLIVVGIITTVVFQYLQPLQALVRPDEWGSINTWILLGVGLLLFVLWIKVPIDELPRFEVIGVGFQPQRPWFAFPAVIIVAIAFIALMFASVLPVLFGFALLMIKLIETWNAEAVKRNVARAARQIWATSDLPRAQRNAGMDLRTWHAKAMVMYRFYVEYPWYLLAVAEVVALAIGTVIAAYAAAPVSDDLRRLLSFVATLTLAVAVLGNEVGAALLRRRCDRELLALTPISELPEATIADYAASIGRGTEGKPRPQKADNSLRPPRSPRASLRDRGGVRTTNRSDTVRPESGEGKTPIDDSTRPVESAGSDASKARDLEGRRG